MTYHFAPGEHDEFICGHILSGFDIDGTSVEHRDYPDGSVDVDFPLPAETVEQAILTYSRADYEPESEPPLKPDELKALRALLDEGKRG